MQNYVVVDKLKPQRSSCLTFSVDQSQCSVLNFSSLQLTDRYNECLLMYVCGSVAFFFF